MPFVDCDVETTSIFWGDFEHGATFTSTNDRESRRHLIMHFSSGSHHRFLSQMHSSHSKLEIYELDTEMTLHHIDFDGITSC